MRVRCLVLRGEYNPFSCLSMARAAGWGLLAADTGDASARKPRKPGEAASRVLRPKSDLERPCPKVTSSSTSTA